MSELVTSIAAMFFEKVYNTRFSALPKLVISEASNFPELARFYLDEVINRGRRLLTALFDGGSPAASFARSTLSTRFTACSRPWCFRFSGSIRWDRSMRSRWTRRRWCDVMSTCCYAASRRMNRSTTRTLMFARRTKCYPKEGVMRPGREQARGKENFLRCPARSPFTKGQSP